MGEEFLSPLMGHSLARRLIGTGSVFCSTAKNFSKQIKMFVRNDLYICIWPYQQEIRYGGGVAAEGRKRASPYPFCRRPQPLAPRPNLCIHVCMGTYMAHATRTAHNMNLRPLPPSALLVDFRWLPRCALAPSKLPGCTGGD